MPAIAARFEGIGCCGNGSLMTRLKVLGESKTAPPVGLLKVSKNDSSPLFCPSFKIGIEKVWR